MAKKKRRKKRKKRGQLFCEHLENIQGKFLEECADIVRQFLSHRQGIYALYRKGRAYYVGLASNLRNRLKHHLKDRHKGKWDRFSIYLVLSPAHLKEIEALVLRISKPRGNKVRGRFVRSRDMKRSLNKQLKEAQNAKRKEYFGGRQSTGKKTPKGGEKVRGIPLSEYITKALWIRAYYKGKRYVAHVRKDGQIRYKGKLYRSPSGAGKAVRGRTPNGWRFWQYQRSPGEWVKLSELRRK